MSIDQGLPAEPRTGHLPAEPGIGMAIISSSQLIATCQPDAEAG